MSDLIVTARTPVHHRRRACFLAAVAAAGMLACRDGGPTGTTPSVPGFNVVSSPRRTDTTAAVPSAPLVLELRDSAGAVRPGVSVTLRASQRGTVPTLYLDSPGHQNVGPITRTTDSRGRVSVTVRFGVISGDAGVVGSAPELAMEDTIAFTVLPGRPDGVRIAPRDTAVVLNATVTLAIFVRDYWGNPRPEQPTVEVGPGISRAPDGTITGVAYGRSIIRARYGAWRDSGSVAVVPPGRIAGMHGSSVFYAFVMNTDGSAANPWLKEVGWSNGPVHWSPDAHLLLAIGDVWAGPFRLVELAPGGTERLAWTPPAGTNQGWPELSRDRAWLYFEHVLGPDHYGTDGVGGIWRVRRDGTEPAEVVPPPTSGAGLRSPSLSPSGDELAYVGGPGTVYVRRLTDGATTTIAGLEAINVQWSPVGERLLVAGRAGLHVMSPDGSGRRQLRASAYSSSDASWSPDGGWIIWLGPTGVELVRVDDTELFVTLPFFRGPALEGGWGFAWAASP